MRFDLSLRSWIVRHAGGHLAHHLRAALVVGSVVTLLHWAGLLGGLEGLMQATVGSAGPAFRTAAPTDLPIVALVSAELHEREFAQSSPLSRDHLARILLSTPTGPATRPASVVIDIDLSPGPEEGAGHPGRAAINSAIQRLLTAGVDVILASPVRVQTEGLQRLKFDWMKKLCRWNDEPPAGSGRLAFGLTDLTIHQGTVIQFNPALPSVGVVAADARSGAALCAKVLDPSDRWRSPLVGMQFSSDVMERRGEHGYGLRPFNARFFTGDGRNIVVLRSLEFPNASQEGAPSLAGKVLFLGAAFSPLDRFLVPLEGSNQPVEGAVVHAATYYSMLHPVTVPSALLAFVLEIGLGVGLGYLFALLWKCHLQVHARYSLHATSATGLRAVWVPRASLALVLLSALLVAVASLLLAQAFLYPLNLWVSPAPIVFGMFIKLLLATRSGSHEHSSAHSSPHGALWAHRIDTALIALVTVAALAAVTFLHH